MDGLRQPFASRLIMLRRSGRARWGSGVRFLQSIKIGSLPWARRSLFHWMSDGMRVQGWLVYPTDYSPDKKYPMVVSVHGGPAVSALSHWPAAFDNVGILSSFGYFILYPNPRGVFGSGESFTQGNVKNLGYGDLRDIEAGVKQVIGTLPVDPRRVGITGWSYGGFHGHVGHYADRYVPRFGGRARSLGLGELLGPD